MTIEKWVRCTEQLAENPERVKAWKSCGLTARFLTYDKGHKRPIIVRRYIDDALESSFLNQIECLIEVPIQEFFITFYEDDGSAGTVNHTLENAKNRKAHDCTHIVKLTFDGKDFKAECVWTKESNS